MWDGGVTTRAAQHSTTLEGLDPTAVPAYLDAHSGLPGPRGNLELVVAFARVWGRRDLALVDALLADPDEYRRMCGTVVAFDAVLRIDTPGEADYYRNGGILQYVLRSLVTA